MLHSALSSNQLHNPKGIQYAEDLNTFNSHNWHNSGLQWNETAAKWIAKPSSGTGGTGTVDTANSPNANEFARFTDSDTIEGRTYAEARVDLDLKTYYAGSSQVAGRFYPSSLGKSLMNFSANKSLYPTSSNVNLLKLTNISATAFAGKNISLSGAKYTWAYQSMKDSGNEWYAAYKHSANASIHANTSGSLHKLWTWSSNKSWYAQSSNVRSRFPGSSTAITKFAISTNVKTRFVQSGGTKWVDLTDGGTTTLHTHTGIGGVSYWSSQTNKSLGSIYYRAGEVIIAPSGTDYGNYRLQVSGNTFFSGSVQFIGEISGLSDPVYNSGAANKHYVNYPTFVSSQKVSGGVVKSNVFYGPAPITYSIENIRLSAQQVINMARFKTPINKQVYIWQAHACNSSQNAIHGLFAQVLSGSRIRFQTSSATLRQGYPISSTTGGNTTVRFGYSAATALTGIHYGTAMIQVSVI